MRRSRAQYGPSELERLRRELHMARRAASAEWQLRRQALDALREYLRDTHVIQWDDATRLGVCGSCGGKQADEGSDMLHAQGCKVERLLDVLGDVYTVGPPDRSRVVLQIRRAKLRRLAREEEARRTQAAMV
jgi:hypothetical protein